MPRLGRGELQKIAGHLRMHPTRVSHIFKGDVHLTLEQAGLLCKYFGFSQIESEYFITLVQISRAGGEEIKDILKNQAANVRERANKLENRIIRDRILTENEKAVFYSSWLYTAIRLLSSIERYQNVDAIADHFKMPRENIREILEFLVSAGLCKNENSQYSMSVKRTHLEASSILARQQHANWRVKALSRYENLSERELAYTCPVSINRVDQLPLKELLRKTIEEFLKNVTASEPPDMVACLNIDWFEF